METVTLFTRQHDNALRILKEDGVFRMKPEWIRRKYGDISEYYMKAYDWLALASARRVPRPPGVTYPIWCSVDEGYMLREIPGETVFKLSLDKSRVIYFDSPKWDMILNYMYLPRDPADEAAFLEKLRQRGILNPFSLYDPSQARFYPELQRLIVDSWQRVFEISDWNKFTVQANIWEIRPEDVVEIRSAGEEPRSLPFA